MILNKVKTFNKQNHTITLLVTSKEDIKGRIKKRAHSHSSSVSLSFSWVLLNLTSRVFSCWICYHCRSPDVHVNLNVPFTTSPHGHVHTDLALLQEVLICPNVLLAIGKPFAQPHVVTLKSAIYCVSVDSHVTLQNSESKTSK